MFFKKPKKECLKNVSWNEINSFAQMSNKERF